MATDGPGSPLLSVSSIETLYFDRIHALLGVSLEVGAGEVFAVLGPNGAGKTTLLRTIAGLLKDQPKKGEIRFAGQLIERRPPERIANLGVVYVPEDRGLFRELTVEENLRLGLWGRRDGSIAADLEFVYGMFPILRERTRQEAETLSGGEQQMLALARAMLRRPRLLMLDEPSLGLAPQVAKAVFEALDRDQRARHDDPPGGAERPAGPPDRPPRGDPGVGPDRAPGAGGRAGGEPGRARGVPGGERRRRRLAQGLAALPQAEAMVMETITPAAGTFPELFLAQVRRQGPALALRHKVYGVWQRVSWAEYGEAVERVAGGLLAAGLAPGERVAILGDNRPEWLYCHLGAMTAGGATCGIYATSSPEQIRYLLQHSEARCLFVENEEQLEKALTVIGETAVARVVVWDAKGLWGFADERVTFFEDFLKQGQAFREANPGRLERARAAIGPDDVAMIIYTSGTTGPPKGAMLSHRNILWEIESLSRSVPLEPGDEVVSYLPFAHIFENFTSVFWPVRLGIVVSFAESVDTLFQNLREVSPTYFAGPPRIWEKLASTLDLRMADSTPLKRRTVPLRRGGGPAARPRAPGGARRRRARPGLPAGLRPPCSTR